MVNWISRARESITKIAFLFILIYLNEWFRPLLSVPSKYSNILIILWNIKPNSTIQTIHLPLFLAHISTYLVADEKSSHTKKENNSRNDSIISIKGSKIWDFPVQNWPSISACVCLVIKQKHKKQEAYTFLRWKR